MAAIPVSSAVGSTLSSILIGWGHGVMGLAGWRFMFLVEGLPAIALAVATWFCLTDKPADATWLEEGKS
jgi:sugar phosphate permease